MLTRSVLSRHNPHLQRLGSCVCSKPLSGRAVAHRRSLAVSRRLLTTKQDLRPWQRKAFRSLLGYLPERRLATALDDYKSIDGIPFDSITRPTNATRPTSRSPPALYDIQPFDPSSPLVMKEPPPRVMQHRPLPGGVPGGVDEMIAVFEACIQVGKLERAALVLKRLHKTNSLDSLDLVAAHNAYLGAVVDEILASPNLGKAEELHKWYELYIHSDQLPQTAATIAYMLKASLITAHGPRLERLVNRYMGMVPGDEGLEVLYMTDILTDQDRATITDICPTYNLAAIEDGTAAAESTEPTDEEQSEFALPHAPSHVEVPEVLSTPQKGMGLLMLKQALSLFSDIPKHKDISTLSVPERREIQARLERDCIDAAVQRWREENESLSKMGLNTALNSASLNAKLFDWQKALEKYITEELERVTESEESTTKTHVDQDRCVYGPFLRQSTPGRLAAVTILSILSSLTMQGASKGVPLSAALNGLSKIAEEDIKLQARSKASSRKVKASQAATMKALRRAKGQMSADDKVSVASSFNSMNDAPLPWPVLVRTKVAAALLQGLIQTAKLNVVREHPDTKELHSQLQPAFTHASVFKRGRRVGLLMANAALVDILSREPRGEFLARHLPMVVEPEPWTRFDKGGFLESPSPLVRLKNGEKDQKIYTEAAIERGDMDQVLKGLDVLGKTAWKINKSVFDVMLEAWNTGEAIAEIPPLNPEIPLPPEPESSDNPVRRTAWIRAVRAVENEKSGLHSVRCFMNFQLEIARAFRDQTVYFPHNIDFRGRAYPMPTYLNHMGADHVRGLMTFAEGKELGEEGLKWLKVHLSNVFGYDKASLKDRESFAMEHLTDVFDSANNPLTGNRWWLKAEEPWQCLATCFELKAALDLPEPTKYVSHLPIHQDGTCNGLQHYAALGGDTWGARHVNLEPGDKPADVYSAVADLVKESIAKDLEHDHPFAKAITGKITRKVVKQTVMTNVYGVTYAGARKQVLKQLDSLYPQLRKESGIDPNLLASYIATKIFKALSTMFDGAHGIQTWLGEIGSRVCRSLSPEQLDEIEKGHSQQVSSKSNAGKAKKRARQFDELRELFRATIIWTTPLRMPVVQPYRKSGTRVISTCLQDLVLTEPGRFDPVHRRKQLQAFPPNFIHSLDASHMLLSALECDDLGLTFAAVHDSFWTHAGDVNTMNRVLRDSFIRIHSEDVIGRLAAEFEARYKGSIYLARVEPGPDVIKEVNEWRKSRRLKGKDEVLLEKKRIELLNSSVPSEVVEGEAMVTPASIVGRASALVVEPEDIESSTLGAIPDNEKAVAEAVESLIPEDLEDETSLDPQPSEEAEAEIDDSWKMMGTSHFELHVTAPKKKSASKQKASIDVWLPLTFPSIPKKGDFDVSRLKMSKYFFS